MFALVRKIKLDQIERTNAEGQVVNIAREAGTNKENVQDLSNNIKINGVLLDAQPPFVGTNFQLFDGFTRTEGIISMGLEYWVFNVVEPKEGFTWSDVWDEIGLGSITIHLVIQEILVKHLHVGLPFKNKNLLRENVLIGSTIFRILFHKRL